MLVSGRDTLRSKFSYGGNGGSASGMLWALPVATEPPGAGGALFECAPRFVVADSTRLLFRSGTLGVWNVMRAAAFETAATGRPWLLSGSGTFGVSVVPLVAAAFEAAATGLAAAAWVVAGAATSSAGGGLALIVRLFRQSFQKRPSGSFSSGPGACLGRGGEVRLFEVLEVRLRLPERLRRGIEARLLGRGIESLESKWLRR